MLNFGNKEFRNLQEQVLYLSNRSNFGLNIKGEVETVPQLGDIPNTNIGDVYLVGKAAPFNFYIKTADKTWTNLGKLESNVPGPQGLQGIQGIKGTDGSVIYTNNQPESANNGDLYISNDGKLYQYDNEWKLVTSLRGSIGPVGPKGPQGERGLQGERGERGEKGDTGIGIRIGGNVATEDLLPSKPVGDTNAYLVGNGSPYELYVWNGTGWLNSGEFGTLDNIQVITIKAPETATSGQLDAGQLNQVIESTSALIKHGNLIYRKEAVISTKAIYRCITDDFLYVISVNIDTGSWVKTSQGLPVQKWTVDDIPSGSINLNKLSNDVISTIPVVINLIDIKNLILKTYTVKNNIGSSHVAKTYSHDNMITTPLFRLSAGTYWFRVIPSSLSEAIFWDASTGGFIKNITTKDYNNHETEADGYTYMQITIDTDAMCAVNSYSQGGVADKMVYAGLKKPPIGIIITAQNKNIYDTNINVQLDALTSKLNETIITMNLFNGSDFAKGFLINNENCLTDLSSCFDGSNNGFSTGKPISVEPNRDIYISTIASGLTTLNEYDKEGNFIKSTKSTYDLILPGTQDYYWWKVKIRLSPTTAYVLMSSHKGPSGVDYKEYMAISYNDFASVPLPFGYQKFKEDYAYKLIGDLNDRTSVLENKVDGITGDISVAASSIYGKSIAYFGDSLMFGAEILDEETADDKVIKGIWGRLNDKYKLRMNANNSKGGATIEGGHNDMSIAWQMLRFDNSNTDIVLFTGGFNDAWKLAHSDPNYSIGDMPNEFNNGTEDTNNSILSALNNALIHLRNTNPNTTIVWIKTWRTDAIATEIIDVFNAVENLCHAWAIPVVDLFNECNFTLQNQRQRNVYGRVNPPILNKGTRDGTHLSPEGYDKIMAPIEAVLNAHVNK